jgi:hypothetical protein
MNAGSQKRRPDVDGAQHEALKSGGHVISAWMIEQGQRLTV